MELLNGKAKELFWEWFLKQETLKKHKLDTMLKFSNEASVKVHVYSFPEVCQNALIIEWFDSVGITVDVMPILDEKVKFQPNTFWLEKEIITEEIEYFETRQEATTEAIKKAVELINESNG